MKEHHRKESPILSLLGLGGGIGGGLAGGGAATNTEASGGVIHEYTDGTDKYKVHVFTHPGSFTVTTVGSEKDADFEIASRKRGCADRYVPQTQIPPHPSQRILHLEYGSRETGTDVIRQG